MRLDEISEYFKENLYEMSNFNDNTTGLSPGTKLWVREEPNGLQHTKYRIKISNPQNGSAVFSLWGDETQQVAGAWVVKGKDLKKIETLIRLTHDSLRNHIDGLEDSGELANTFKTVKSEIKNI